MNYVQQRRREKEEKRKKRQTRGINLAMLLERGGGGGKQEKPVEIQGKTQLYGELGLITRTLNRAGTPLKDGLLRLTREDED